MAFIRANGVVLHHQVLGRPDGPALVFINSLGSDLRIWQEVAPAFLESCRVVLYDKRGHGLSDAPPAPYTMTITQAIFSPCSTAWGSRARPWSGSRWEA